MECENSTAFEADSPAIKRPEKFSRTAACNTKYDFKWCNKCPVKALSSQPNFLCVFFFSGEFNCAHQSEADIKRHILTNTHQDKSLSLRQLLFYNTISEQEFS